MVIDKQLVNGLSHDDHVVLLFLLVTCINIYIMIIPITWQLRLYYLKIIIKIIIMIIIIIIINENNDRPDFANKINTNHYPGFINNIQTYLHEKVLQLLPAVLML